MLRFVQKLSDNIKKIISALISEINKLKELSSEKMKVYYNLQHENISIFRTEQKIYLSCKNFKIKQLNEKLDY